MSYDTAIWTAAALLLAVFVWVLRWPCWYEDDLPQVPGLSRRASTGASAQAGPGAGPFSSPPSPGNVPRPAKVGAPESRIPGPGHPRPVRAQAAGKPGSEFTAGHGPGRPDSDWLDDLAEASKAACLAKHDGPREPPERQVLEAVLVQGEYMPLTDVAPPAGPWLQPPRSGPWVPVRDNARVPCADTAWDREQAAWLRELLAVSREGYASLGEFAASRRPS